MVDKMRGSSPTLAKRAPSPSSSSSPLSAVLAQSRSLPTQLQQGIRQSFRSRSEAGTRDNSGILRENQQGRVFSRAVSDRVKQAVEVMHQKEVPFVEAAAMDLEQLDIGVEAPSLQRNEMVSPRRGGQRRKKNDVDRVPSKSPRRFRYDRVARQEDEDAFAPSRRSREDTVSPLRKSRKQPVDVRRARNNKSAPDVEEQADLGNRETDDRELRRSWTSPVTVKIEPEELDKGKGGAVQNNSRQLKQRAVELWASLPTSFSFSSGGRNDTVSESPPQPQPQTRRSRGIRRGREQSSTSQNSDWFQLTMDIIMWRDFARSTLIFGAGSFFILSASFMQDVHFNIVTILSYVALTYLSAVFFRKNIIRRLPSSDSEASYAWVVSEAAALELTRGALPAVNAILLKLSQLFSGDPATTLKVAGVLWCLAQAGYWMSLWNLLRLAFFGAFLIPKLYLSYSNQLHEQGNYLVSHMRSIWNTCSHKKAILFVALVVAWNLSTMSARLWVAFFSVVALRQYQNSHNIVPEIAVAYPKTVAVKQEH